jgi:hypothetical protein
VTVARKLGFLINLETRKGRPAQLALGAPLPEELEVFPTVEALQCCSAETGVSSGPAAFDGDDAKDGGPHRSHPYEKLDGDKALRERAEIPRLPAGVRLIEWRLKEPPVPIEGFAVVTDPATFATWTLEQLRIAIENPKRRVRLSVAQLLQRLDLVGVRLVLQKGPSENEATDQSKP